MSTAPARPVGLGILSILAGLIGWFASFELLTERIHSLVDLSYVPACNVNILVTCGPNMESWQGSLFGFSNPIIGVAAFVAPILMGAAILAGVRFPRWWWVAYAAGVTLGFAFIVWLISQSLFVLGTMCPWCMVVWTAMIPLFWFTVFHVLRSGHVTASPRVAALFASLYGWAWVFTVVSYLLVAFLAQLQLSWIPRAFL